MARKLKAPTVIVPPPMPPPPALTAHELMLEQKITADLQALVARLEQRCLDNAVLLAQRAARRQGPLVAHFMELGRRYQETLNTPQKPKLRVVEGGSPKQQQSTVAPASEEARIEAAVYRHGSIIAAMRAGAI